jgi:ribonuclease HI
MQATILNVDGSSFDNPDCSDFGGVLRTLDETWLCGFLGFFSISNNLHVELLIMHNLKLTWERGHRNVICYSDFFHAINLIQAPLNAWHVYATIMKKNVKDILNLPWNVQLTHTI